MLDVEELCELEDAIRKELDEHLTTVLAKLNRTGELETLLCLLDMEHLLKQEPGYQVFKTGKIIVIGQSDVRKEDLLAIAKKLGLDKNRFEFHLGYEDAKNYDFSKTRWQASYSLIMVGPMPHSGSAKGDSGSIIASLESQEGYPPIVRLGSNGLKITKSDFKAKLEDVIESRKIA